MAPPPASAGRNDKGKARAGKNATPSSSTRKEQRIAQRRQARTIATQPQASTSSSSTSSTLAPQLDVEPYLLSRRFEIAALRKAIKTSRSSSATRAWQLLPRHARRRAASHNVLRLPSRLRAKGLAELRSSTTLAKTRSQIRKRLPNHPMAKAEARKLELRGRAARPEARWLETHLWLAKRFRMSREEFDGDRWGCILPEEPYMKGEKTDWRATNGGCAIWDASWEQWVRVGVKLPKSAKGKEREMDVDGDFGAARGTLQQEEAVQLLEKLTTVARLVAGGSASGEALRLSASTSQITAFSATLHGGIENTNSDRALCPAKLYLVLPTRSEPVARSNDTTPTAGPSSSSSTAPAQPANPPQAAQARRLRRLLRLLPPPPQQSEINPDAELLVRTHPAAVDTLHRALQAAVIRVAKEATEKEEERAHFIVQRLEGPPADIVVGDDAAQRSPSRKGKTSPSPSVDADPCPSSAKLAQTHLSSHLKHRLSLLRQAELRNRAFCTFELYGPKSGEVLGRVLQLSAKGTNEETRRRWEEMTAKPTGDEKKKVNINEAIRPKDSSGFACLSVRVHDPRLGLRRGPTTRAPGRKGGAHKGKKGQSKQGPAALSPSVAKEASSNQAARAPNAGKRKLADSDLSADAEGPPSKAARTLEGEQNVPHPTAEAGDPSVLTTRHPHLLTNGYPYPSQTQGDLDSRRSALLASGLAATSKKRGRARTTSSLLEPTSKDDVIPVVIVSRADGVQGFTLLVPQGWGRPFWHALLGSKAIPGTGSGEVRPLGLGGWRALQRETGRASYPEEWPYAPAVASKGRGREKRPGVQATAWQRSVSFAAAKREEEWARRPKAKRINYEKLGVSWPFGGLEMWMSCVRAGEGVLREELLKLGQISGKAKPDEKITTERADKDAGHGLHLHGSTLLLRAQIFWLRQLLATTTVVPPSAHQLLLGRARSLLLHFCSSSTSAASSRKPTKRDTSHALVLLNVETLPGTGGALSEGDELHLLPYAEATQGSNEKAVDGKRQPIGGLTSGRFSLTRGRSTGMALCSASAWVWAVGSSHSSAWQSSRATPFATEVGKGEGEGEGDEIDVAAEKKRLKKVRGLIALGEQGLSSIWQGTVDSVGSNGVEEWESARLIVRSISGGTEREVVARLVRV